jgi:hypothetical protein
MNSRAAGSQTTAFAGARDATGVVPIIAVGAVFSVNLAVGSQHWPTPRCHTEHSAPTYGADEAGAQPTAQSERIKP